MTAILYGKRFQCDVDLFQAEITDAGDWNQAYLDEVVPEGWTSLRAVFFGQSISHLCPHCSALPFGEVVRRIQANMLAAQESQKARA